MKRYLLFGGECYYGCGGWNDFIHSFDTMIEARAIALELREYPINYLSDDELDSFQAHDVEWWHTVDGDIGVIIDRSEVEPYRNYGPMA